MSGPKDRTDLTGAVLLFVFDHVLDHGAISPSLDDEDNAKLERARKTAYSELKRIGLVDEIGNPTKEGRRLLGLV